ncbi:hypothetical protein ABRP72_13205 [Pectobacterium carotovorum]|uniref:hypothetical protein n=1 Tax=Pectobacterium carotovorum TaxID=554 RepID=UPI0032EF88B4
MDIWEEQIKNTVYHEVGHWIAVKEFGFECQKIKLGAVIENDRFFLNSGAVLTFYNPSLRTLDEVLKYLEERAVVGVSGINCQIIALGTEVKTASERYGSGDLEKARELSFIYNGMKHPEEESNELREEYNNEFIMKAFIKSKEIIDKNLNKIVLISERIISMIDEKKSHYDISVSQINKWYSESE